MIRKILPDVQDIIALLVLVLSIMTFAHIDAKTIGITLGLTLGIIISLSVLTEKDDDTDE